MRIWTVEEEAQRLQARFKDVPQAQFARTHNLPGGASMLSQHIKGRRPINLEAARIYAIGFGCTLEEISPRLAREVQKAANLGQKESAEANSIAGINLMAALQDWRLQASARSQKVIDQLTLLAKKNKLRDEDWELIEQLVLRFTQK